MAFGRFLEPRHGPFAELQQEINNMFDTLVARQLGLGRGLLSRAFPPANVYEDKEALYIECELPGVDQEGLELFITGDVLTLKGERPALQPEEGTTVHINERGYGSFSRAITLPVDVESDKVEARYDNGILTIRLPKAPEARPKQVQVHAE